MISKPHLRTCLMSLFSTIREIYFPTRTFIPYMFIPSYPYNYHNSGHNRARAKSNFFSFLLFKFEFYPFNNKKIREWIYNIHDYALLCIKNYELFKKNVFTFECNTNTVIHKMSRALHGTLCIRTRRHVACLTLYLTQQTSSFDFVIN